MYDVNLGTEAGFESLVSNATYKRYHYFSDNTVTMMSTFIYPINRTIISLGSIFITKVDNFEGLSGFQSAFSEVVTDMH